MKKLDSLLPPELLSKMRLNNLLTREVRNFLAPVSGGLVTATGLDAGKLRLTADNAATATVLRYQQTELIKHLNTNPNLKITHISVSVSSSVNH